MAERRERPRACVLAPAPLLTVTIEEPSREGGHDELHLHAGGQGFWIARLLAELGVDVVLCATFGGETGTVLPTIITGEGVTLRAIEAQGSNGAYVHDRRSGERVEVAAMPAAPLSRHEVDELYGAALVEGLESDVVVLGGPSEADVLPAEFYERLAKDLRAGGAAVIADLSGEPLQSALAGGLTVLKVSAEEMARDELVQDEHDQEALVTGMRSLAEQGAQHVIVTRAERGNLALLDGQLFEVTAPELEVVDTRGSGDSLTAGVAAALARGGDLLEAVRLGTAAGAINVTRKGLATASREDVVRFARHVDVEEDPQP